MAKRDVWVRVGNELVRGDSIVGITVESGRSFYQSYKLLMKVTGHRDPLVVDSGFSWDGTGEDECHKQATALADSFVNTLARAAAFPTGALIRLGSDTDNEGGRSSGWDITVLG
ncbi:hypothetical protein [Streptosporangium lutulentum]|uniref:Uncharacterized protein n=1 Tax=Streptosporangium lutulentum TaxID=1461250 RepID=A0ABT9QWQ0_9ACTN|nr:hypothetical protein [Streptosporangium lutulentum]MDP9850459.1 hypothetical protein [Streptosporangium lutulentum]